MSLDVFIKRVVVDAVNAIEDIETEQDLDMEEESLDDEDQD
jgi:hypothetical protein